MGMEEFITGYDDVVGQKDEEVCVMLFDKVRLSFGENKRSKSK